MAFRLAARARRDLNTILAYSFEKHGRDAADRYQLLLKIAMEEVGNQPDLNWSYPVMGKPGVRYYAISHSRLRVPREDRVTKPTHQLVYRLSDEGVVEILAIIGNSYPAARVSVPR